MKNIHVLSTDKPSRLFIYENVLELVKELNYISSGATNQNIYITSDKEIKEGDWWLNLKTNDVDKCTHRSEVLVFNSEKYQHIKKIILTTNQDLIKDGVQAIDDEFLEWFVAKANDSGKPIDIVKVKNSILKIPNRYDDDYRAIPYLKIIIPKEESVFSQLEVGKDFEQEEFELGEEEVECNMCGNIMSLLEDESNYACFNSECTRCYEEYEEEPKQETLEEAALKHCELLDKYPALENPLFSFKEGAKWQQERSYSEEEVLKLLISKEENTKDSTKYNGVEYITPEEWFEQFKKK